MIIKELTELQKRGVDVNFRRHVVRIYELGFIIVEQVVHDLKISPLLLSCLYYLHALDRLFWLQRVIK